jgi:hypothetical protein
MRYFIDSKFIDDGKTIELISIAVVAENGREFLRYNDDFQEERAMEWVCVNALPYLPQRPLFSEGSAKTGLWRSPLEIGIELLEFIGSDPEPEFWANVAAHNWVAVCQLYGPLAALPKGWPVFCQSVQQLRAYLDHQEFSGINGQESNALSAAKECKACYDYLIENSIGGFMIGGGT